MERYVAFGGNQFYPGGGMNDFIGSLHELETLITHTISKLQPVNPLELDDLFSQTKGQIWAHIYDTEAGIMVWVDGKFF